MKSNPRRILTSSILIVVVALASLASPSYVIIAPPGEPGERLVVTGHVFGPDGRPISGIEVYAYHTDASGYYRADHKMHGPMAPPRLEGRLRTGSEGSYRIDTIKPAPYPSRTVRAHIHFRFHAVALPHHHRTPRSATYHPPPLAAPRHLHST